MARSRPSRFHTGRVFVLALLGVALQQCQAQVNGDICPNAVKDDLSTLLSSVLSKNTYPSPVPGMTVAVTRYDAALDLFSPKGSGVIGTRRWDKRGNPDFDMDIKDVQRIGSCTKSFTATIMIMLDEQGVINIDDTLPNFFASSFKMHPVLAQATVRDVLNHRAGLIRDLPINFPNSVRTLQQQRAYFSQYLLAANSPHNRQVTQDDLGTFVYCNTGYYLLSYIAESATGKQYESLVQDWLFTPLNLTSAGWYEIYDPSLTSLDRANPNPNDIGPFGHSLKPGSKTDYNVMIGQTNHFAAAGGDIHMSAPDLAAWGAYHLGGYYNAPDKCPTPWKPPCVSKAGFRALHEPPKSTPDKPTDYAMGWQNSSTVWAGKPGKGYLTHTGAINGWYSEQHIWADNYMTFAIVTNHWRTLNPVTLPDDVIADVVTALQAKYDVFYPWKTCGPDPNIVTFQSTFPASDSGPTCTHTTQINTGVAVQTKASKNTKLSGTFTPEECAAKCVGNVACVAWSHQTDTQNCFLITPTGSSPNTADRSSLYTIDPSETLFTYGEAIYTSSNDTNFKAPSIAPTSTDESVPCTDTAAACKALCQGLNLSGACGAWSWNASTKKCYQYTSSDDFQLVSYPLDAHCSVTSGVLGAC